jgi:hypothetical protein
MVRCPDRLASPLCTSKQRWLPINNENLANPYIIENNKVIKIMATGQRKNAGEKMKVSSIMLLKTNGGEMSEIGLSIMLMKRKQLAPVSPLY